MIRVLFLMFTLLSTSPAMAQVPSPLAGSIDLSRQAFSGRESWNLGGTWAWYPGVLLSAEVPREAPHLVSVPGPVHMDKDRTVVHGWGSYRLEIKLPENLDTSTMLALRVPIIASNYRIWWNGERVAGEGIVSSKQSDHRAAWVPAIVPLKNIATRNTLVLEVSNYQDFHTGITDMLEFGYLGVLERERSSRVLGDMFLFGSLFFMGFYHLGFWFFRRKDKTLLFFGITAMLLAIRPFFYNDVFIMELIPDFPWEVLVRGGYLTFSLGALTFGLFIYSLYPRQVFHSLRLKRAYLNLVLIPNLVYTFMVVIFPVQIFSPLLIWYQAFIVLLGIATITVLIRGILLRQDGSILFLSGFTLFFATVIHDILRTNALTTSPFLSSLGLLLFLFFQSVVIIQRYSASFKLAEDTSVNLNQVNQSLQRFIPREVLGFLKKKSIQDIKLGEYVQTELTVLCISLAENGPGTGHPGSDLNFNQINASLNAMGKIVRRHNGFIDKYHKRGILALFPASPLDALKVVLEISSKLPLGSTGFSSGVHFGNILIGAIGEHNRMDSTIISDAVHIALRLQELCHSSRKNCYVSKELADALARTDEFQLIAQPEAMVPGREHPIRVLSFEPRGRQ